MIASTQTIIQETVKIFYAQSSFLLCYLYRTSPMCQCDNANLQTMYNQYSQLVLDLYRKHFGFIAFRERAKARKDAFFQFHVNEESASDQEALRRLSVAITKITDMCFQECVDTHYQLFTTDEESCVKRCVQSYFKGYEAIGFYTQRGLSQ